MLPRVSQLSAVNSDVPSRTAGNSPQKLSRATFPAYEHLRGELELVAIDGSVTASLLTDEVVARSETVFTANAQAEKT